MPGVPTLSGGHRGWDYFPMAPAAPRLDVCYTSCAINLTGNETLQAFQILFHRDSGVRKPNRRRWMVREETDGSP
jgi:hypothetical protein